MKPAVIATSARLKRENDPRAMKSVTWWGVAESRSTILATPPPIKSRSRSRKTATRSQPYDQDHDGDRDRRDRGEERPRLIERERDARVVLQTKPDRAAHVNGVGGRACRAQNLSRTVRPVRSCPDQLTCSHDDKHADRSWPSRSRLEMAS